MEKTNEKDLVSRFGNALTFKNEHGKYCILYNHRAPAAQVNKALAHEMGHIDMGHIKNTEYLDEKDKEKGANTFAEFFLCPDPVLEQAQIAEKDDIILNCCVPPIVANKKAKKRDLEYKKDKKNTEAFFLENSLTKKFSGYIKKQKELKKIIYNWK